MKKPSEFTFNTTDIKGKQYVEVSERLRYLESEFFGNYSINTDYEFLPDFGMFICRATLLIQFEGMERAYSGLAQEVVGEGFINKTSALENCETSAVGRACAMAGIGIIDSVASVDEVTKAKNREQTKIGEWMDVKEKERIKHLVHEGKIEEAKIQIEYWSTDGRGMKKAWRDGFRDMMAKDNPLNL